ncbi:MAG: BREX system ATP-binding domain-containing protein [Roseiarcus sp.]
MPPRPTSPGERFEGWAWTRPWNRNLAGGRISLADVKQWLREVGAAKLFAIKPVKQPDLVRQRLRFVPRLMAAAGYGGWVLLLDEVELIGRYGVLQRGRSYAELARWLGLDDEERIPGVVAVAAITDDFVSEVIRKRRDEEKAPLKLTERNERRTAARARRGIDALETKQALLRPPDAELLEASLDKTRGFYAEAYGWSPAMSEVGEITATKSMRQYIKSWITAWDLERRYGLRPAIETQDLVADYQENRDIEQAVARDGDYPNEEAPLHWDTDSR